MKNQICKLPGHNKLRNILYFVLWLFFYLIVSQSQVQAQTLDDKLSLKVWPIKFEWQLQSNENKQGKIFIKNDGTEKIKIQVTKDHFEVMDESGQARFSSFDQSTPLEDEKNIRSWIEVEPEFFDLEPATKQEVNFSVTVPENQPTGSYLGAIFFSQSQLESDQSADRDVYQKLQTSAEIGSLLIVGVQGKENIIKNLDLKQFLSKSLYISEPIELDGLILNKGNLHFPVQGSVKIIQSGETVYRDDINRAMIYPSKKRSYHWTWQPEQWQWGKFQSIASLFDPDGNQINENQLTFWYFPLKIIIITIFLIIALIFCCWYFLFKKRSLFPKSIKK